ncbi:MAG: flavin-dependent monooxygenase QhpG [Steroidobacteraceae bacterium]
MQSSADIAILGAGPAAVATACGLRRLGHDCVLIGVSRNTAVEGMSERTHSLLRQAGLVAAASTLPRPTERTGTWAGEAVPGGRECVVDRVELDAALLIDAVSNGVTIRNERALGYERHGSLWRVQTERGELLCRTLVDARGRRAQRPVVRGPELIAVCQRFRYRHAGQSFTRIEAAPQGWCWLAVSRGMGWLQVTSSRKEPSLRLGLKQHIGRFIASVPRLAAALADAAPLGAPLARAATATLSADPQRAGMLRIGDAALALDPLSGQGVYEALRGAHITTAAAHTFLATGQWEPIEQFLAERTSELWQRRNAAAALHYLRQAQSTPTVFWSQCNAHYSSLRAPRSSDPRAPRIERRPVLNGMQIEVRRVVVTPQCPRGVWQVEAVDLPELMDVLEAREVKRGDVERAAGHLCRPPGAVVHALQWLRAQGLYGESEPAHAGLSSSTARQA